MSKLNYVLKRIKNMDFKKMFETVDLINKKEGITKIHLLLDIIYCGFKYQAGYSDYKLYEMYKMNSKEKATVITRGVNNNYIKTLNNKEYISYFSDKIKFNDTFKKYLNRDYLSLNEKNYQDFEKFVKKHPTFIAKPVSESCGKGIEKITVTNENKKEVFKELIESKRYLIEEVATQCETISKLHPSSINTIRVVTMKNKVVFAVLRIGNNNNIVDNFNHGGMATTIDITTGRINYPAIDKVGNLYEVHPLTKEKIVGIKIHNWDEIKKLCVEASKIVPEVGYVGWDVCDGEKKPFLIEANEFPGYDVYQLPPHRPLPNIGLKPEFDKVFYSKD